MATCKSVGMLAQQSLLPVTALEFCTVSSSLCLLAGEGPHLKVFSKDGRLLTHAELLPFSKIHGIRPAPHLSSTGGDGVDSSRAVLVFGQKNFRFVTLQQPTGNTSLWMDCSSAVVSLEDWVLDVCWLDKDASRDTLKVAAVTAHNAVDIVECSGCGFGREARVVAQFHCEVNCILYSARLEGGSVSGLTVASGTVFNEVLLWHLEGEGPSRTGARGERVKVRLSLSGHEGVIFSMRFSTDHSRLVSVSDDRTVRVWDLPTSWKSMERCRQSSCLLVLYGHSARVWDARLLTGCIVSIGEDAKCRVWECEGGWCVPVEEGHRGEDAKCRVWECEGGRCVQVEEGHRGRSIWSMAVDERSGLVATGGGDCSIRLFSLHTHSKDNTWAMDTTLPVSGLELGRGAGPAEETPRSVLLCGQMAFCLANTGSLYACDISAQTAARRAPGVTWQLVHWDAEFSGYAVMSLSLDQHWLALGSLQGFIRLLKLEKNGLCVSCAVKWGGHEGKVFSLTWLSSFREYSNSLLTCGPSGEMVVWGVCRPDSSGPTSAAAVEPLARLSLPPSKHRWVTAATLLPLMPTVSPEPRDSETAAASTTTSIESSSCWLVCGDRKGSLHVYQTDLNAPCKSTDESEKPANKYLQPMQSLCGVHGVNGVTHAVVRDGCVVTCGRDGHCRKFSLHSHTGLTELTKFKPVKGMDWIERLFYTDTDQLVLGFHTTDMVLHSVGQNRCIMSISCGGGHRSYGFSSLPEIFLSKKAAVVYIKKSVISLRVVDLAAHLTTPLLQQGFVGREAVSLQVVHTNPATGSAVVAVGSEDCSICLLSLQPDPEGCSLAVKTERFVQGHISSVRALSTSQSAQESTHQQLLFSGGARASLKVWKIHVSESGSEATLEAELSVHEDPSRHGRRKRRKKPVRPGAESLIPECRIMALTSLPLSLVVEEDTHNHYVAAGCSDGVIRQYIYNEEVHSFNSLEGLQFHNRCVLTLSHITVSSPTRHTQTGDLAPLCLLSAATDGRVAVWNVNPLPSLLCEATSSVSESGVGNGSTEPSGERPSAHPLAVCQAHQSGINDIAITQVNERLYHISTVGDDNALAVLGLTLPADCTGTARLEVLCVEPSAHASSITGVSYFSPSLAVTTSIDQRLAVWSVGSGDGTDTADSSGCGQSTTRWTVEQVYSQTHDVADVAALTLYQWGQSRAVVVMCGIGIQCIVIEK